MNNSKLNAYRDLVDHYVTDIARDIMKGETHYPVVLEDDEGSFMRYMVLPSPQKAGTETQKLTYARHKAQEIVEEIKGYGAAGPLDYATFEVKA